MDSNFAFVSVIATSIMVSIIFNIYLIPPIYNFIGYVLSRKEKIISTKSSIPEIIWNSDGIGFQY